MSREDIYKRAFQSLLDGELSIQELWEVVNDHLDLLDSRNQSLSESLNDYKDKYENLLSLVSKAHEEHKQIKSKE